MTDRVVDASALMLRVLPPEPGSAGIRNQYTDAFWHAPHLVDAECGHVLRRAVRRGVLSADEGRAALRAASAMIDARYSHDSLGGVAWSLRDQLSYYDALYVALAVRLDLPLVTCDRRLANAPGLPCAVELAAAG